MYDGSNGQLGIYVLVFILYLSFKIGSLFTLNLALPIIFFIYLNVKNLTFACLPSVTWACPWACL